MSDFKKELIEAIESISDEIAHFEMDAIYSPPLKEYEANPSFYRFQEPKLTGFSIKITLGDKK